LTIVPTNPLVLSPPLGSCCQPQEVGKTYQSLSHLSLRESWWQKPGYEGRSFPQNTYEETVPRRKALSLKATIALLQGDLMERCGKSRECSHRSSGPIATGGRARDERFTPTSSPAGLLIAFVLP